MTRPGILPLLMALPALLAGCAGADLKLPREAIARVDHVLVVAMEPRPLSVPPNFGPAPALFGLVGLAAAWSDAEKDAAARSGRLDGRRVGAGEWSPTAALGAEVVAQLSSRGVPARLSGKLQPIPGVLDRSPTLTMENWLAPTRAWAGGDRSIYDYRPELRGSAPLVIEVAMLNYGVAADSSLMIRPVFRVLSPLDGAVVGRASPHNLFSPPRIAERGYFAVEPAAFRQVFERESARLVAQALGEIGFAPAAKAP